SGDGTGAVRAWDPLQDRFRRTMPESPCVAKPESRKDMKRGGFRSAIAHADLDQDVLRCILGVLYEHVEVPITVEDTGAQQFILHVAAVALVGSDQVVVGEGRLRVLVQILHVRVRRSAVEVKIVLL